MKGIISTLLLIVALMAGSFFLGSNYYYYSPFYHRISSATAVIHPTKGNNASGVVIFVQQKDGVHINAHVSGLIPGEHGFHIHEFGNCACDDAVCAGDHFNPTHKPHAGPDDPDRHIGDLGNMVADAEGKAIYNDVDNQLALNGPNSIIGRAVIVHADKDDFKTQPTGNAGARVGCGVIGIAKK